MIKADYETEVVWQCCIVMMFAVLGFLLHSSSSTATSSAPILVLDDLSKISVADVLKDVLPAVESRGPANSIVVKCGEWCYSCCRRNTWATITHVYWMPRNLNWCYLNLFLCHITSHSRFGCHVIWCCVRSVCSSRQWTNGGEGEMYATLSKAWSWPFWFFVCSDLFYVWCCWSWIDWMPELWTFCYYWCQFLWLLQFSVSWIVMISSCYAVESAICLSLLAMNLLQCDLTELILLWLP